MPSPLRHALISLVFCTCALVAAPASAHSFGRLYTLPVPFWLYVYGAVATLIVSFLLIAALATQQHASLRPATRPAPQLSAGMTRLRPWLRALSVMTLLLCILSGLIGVQDPYRNINMTCFWILFILGFAYATAVTGNLFDTLNPWRVLSELPGPQQRLFDGLWTYPRWLGYWPALALYSGFIWIELFGHSLPRTLAWQLLIYSGITFTGMICFGREAWLRHGEFLGVFLRLIARMSPLQHTAQPDGTRLHWRFPFAGLQHARAEHISLTLFILFMLSATAFDGLRGTVPWFRLFWTDPTGLLQHWLGQPPIYAFVQLRPYYLGFESLCLLLSPWLYFAAYALFVWLGRIMAGSRVPMRQLLLDFSFSLLPIALVYHITHYYTLLLSQGVKIVSLLSDPFGWSWDLFGTAQLWRAPILPEMGTVWHTQVGLILFGHVVSVYLAHQQALRSFGSARAALLSQLPMLVLMVLFTTAGLWILAQPMQG